MNKIKACLLLTVCCEEFVQKSFRVSCARMGLQVKSGSGWRPDVDSGEGPQEQSSALHCWKGGPRLQRLESMRCRDGSYHTISYTTTCGALQTDVQFGRESSVFVKSVFL